METITEFLESRIGEDRRYAQAALGASILYPYGHKTLAPLSAEDVPGIVGDFLSSLIPGWGRHFGGRWSKHIARHSPDRVLAECKAKLKLIEMHVACDDVSYGDASTCPELRAIASAYADHPNYQQDWA